MAYTYRTFPWILRHRLGGLVFKSDRLETIIVIIILRVYKSFRDLRGQKRVGVWKCFPLKKIKKSKGFFTNWDKWLKLKSA